MPRPIKQNENPGIHSTAPVKHPAGHTITVYADYAVFDETAGKFVDYNSLDRK